MTRPCRLYLAIVGALALLLCTGIGLIASASDVPYVREVSIALIAVASVCLLLVSWLK